jgi:hypothetical protein
MTVPVNQGPKVIFDLLDSADHEQGHSIISINGERQFITLF